MAKLAIAAAAGVALLSGTLGYVLGRSRPADYAVSRAYYIATRLNVIEEQARTFPRGQALLIGDSITERQEIEELCGLRVFNAGVSGARSMDWTAGAPALIRRLRPRLIIIALGTNDAFAPVPSTEQSLAALRKIVDAADGAVAFVPPWPTQREQDIEGRRAALATAITQALPTLPIPSRAEGLLSDGLHHNERGKALWREHLRAACPRL